MGSAAVPLTAKGAHNTRGYPFIRRIHQQRYEAYGPWGDMHESVEVFYMCARAAQHLPLPLQKLASDGCAHLRRRIASFLAPHDRFTMHPRKWINEANKVLPRVIDPRYTHTLG